MESVGFFYILFFLTILSILGISKSSSQHNNISCNATVDCKVNGNLSYFCCNNICRFDSDCRHNSSSEESSMNDTKPVYSGQSNSNVNLNQSRRYDDFCSKDNDCNSSHRICISFECLTTSAKENIKDCQRCVLIDCKDGRCYNLTSSVVPTSKPGEETITTLQLVLLFGSMGGILIFIIIVYCVKTFTDNRRRQYLLKHGVWDNPPNKEGKDKDDKGDGDTKPDSIRQLRKLEVPTITLETETDFIRKKKNKETSKDEITDTEGLHDFAIQDSKQQKVKTIADQGISDTNQHVNPSTNATKHPYCAQKEIGETIGSPKNIRMPTDWDNEDEKTPLTESPKQKRFANLMKTRNNSPTKIIANGAPDNSPKFGKHKHNSPSVQLCEPENFSDFGM